MAMRVGELARRTGVGVSTLRAWERRHGLLQPERSAAGHRLYGEADVERVNAVVRLVDEGLHLSVAVARVSTGGTSALPVGEGEELFLGQLLDQIEVGIWVARYGRTHYANLHLARLLGYAVDELMQLPVSDLFASEDQDRVQEVTDRFRAGATSKSTVRLRRADGTDIVVRMRATPLPSPTGAYVGGVAVVSDHTDADRRDRLLHLTTSLLDTVADAAVITEPDGSILHLNAAAERTFGRRLADLAGRAGQEVLVAPESAGSLADIERTLRAGRRYAGRVRVVRHDGSSFLAQTTAKLVEDEAGRQIGFVSVIHDHSEHDRVRRELRHREVQAEAVALLGAQALRARADPSLTEAVVAEAVDTARHLVRAEEAAAFVLDPDGVDLQVLHAAPNPTLGSLGPVAGVVAGLTRLARQPVHVLDTAIDPRFEGDAACSALGVPIDGPAGPIGAMVVVSGAPDRVDAAGSQFLQSLANVVGGLVAE